VVGRGRSVRSAVAVVVFGVLAAATLFGSDDWFPFAPMRQYAYAVDPDGRISRHHVEAIGIGGGPVRSGWADIEMRPAELEGLLRPLDTREERLVELLEVFRSARPDAPPTIGIRYVRTMTQLVDRRVTDPQEIELARVVAP
jgi:hypothetical protein